MVTFRGHVTFAIHLGLGKLSINGAISCLKRGRLPGALTSWSRGTPWPGSAAIGRPQRQCAHTLKCCVVTRGHQWGSERAPFPNQNPETAGWGSRALYSQYSGGQGRSSREGFKASQSYTGRCCFKQKTTRITKQTKKSGTPSEGGLVGCPEVFGI